MIPSIQGNKAGSLDFTTLGAPQVRDAAALSCGVVVTLSDRLSLNARYDGLIGNNVSAHGGSVRMLFAF